MPVQRVRGGDSRRMEASRPRARRPACQVGHSPHTGASKRATIPAPAQSCTWSSASSSTPLAASGRSICPLASPALPYPKTHGCVSGPLIHPVWHRGLSGVPSGVEPLIPDVRQDGSDLPTRCLARRTPPDQLLEHSEHDRRCCARLPMQPFKPLLGRTIRTPRFVRAAIRATGARSELCARHL